jgi:NAD-reducing hydrogenase small subunit
MSAERRARLATVWLGGCSGCHMSFLDLDEWLFDLAEMADVVYSPLVDRKVYPTDVDVVLVEGAVTNTDNLEMARTLRANSRIVVSFGDCAVTGNVTALRNPLGDPATMVERVYVVAPDRNGQRPDQAGIVPELLPRALPLHQVVDVDAFLPGCPPSAAEIRVALTRLLDGDAGPRSGRRFG